MSLMVWLVRSGRMSPSLTFAAALAAALADGAVLPSDGSPPLALGEPPVFALHAARMKANVTAIICDPRVTCDLRIASFLLHIAVMGLPHPNGWCLGVVLRPAAGSGHGRKALAHPILAG